MKKILLLLALCAALFLVGCNNNENKVQNNNTNNNQQQNNSQNANNDQNQEEEEDEAPILVYDSPDFSDKAGFKVNLGAGLDGVIYDSIFLMNRSTAQLDLIFPDNTIGTLLVDSTNSSHIYEADDVVLVGDTKVSVEVGADGIIVYEWTKDDYVYVYSTAQDIKNSQKLKDLVNGISIEKDAE